MALESLDIRVRQQGARTVARDIRNVGFVASGVTGQLSTMQRVLRGLAFASVSRRIAAFADEFTNLNNRVRIYSKDQESANRTTNELIDVANRARVATDAVSLTFQRLAINQDRLGLSTERVTRLTELLSKAVTTGGSSAQEASGALRQFSQALSSDFRAAAQELNSVLEQTPGLAKALADGLGTTVDQIKLLAEEGQLNSQLVIQAIESQADAIESRFSRIAPTIGQAFQVLQNTLAVFIGRFFQSSEAGKAITETLIGFSRVLLDLARDEERLNAVVDSTITLFKALIGLRVIRFVSGYTRAIDGAIVSTSRFIGLQAARAFDAIGLSALRASRNVRAVPIVSTSQALAELQGTAAVAGTRLNRLFGAGLATAIRAPFKLLGRFSGLLAGLARGIALAFITNPVGAFVAALALVAAGLFSLRNETVELEGGTVQFRDIAVAAFEAVRDRVVIIANKARDLGAAFLESIGGVRGLANNIIASFVSSGRIVGEFFAALVEDAKQAFTVVGDAAGNVVRAFKLAFEGDFQAAFEALTSPVGDFESQLTGFGARSGQIVGETFARDFLQEAGQGFTEFFNLEDRALEIARRRAARAAGSAGGDGGGGGGGGGDRQLTFTLNQQQEAVAGVISEFDVAARVTLEFLEAQNDLQKAVDKGVISERERANLIEQVATDSFRRLAAETDEAAAATIEYNDRVAELRALAVAGRIGTDELTAAIRREQEALQDTQLDIIDFQRRLSTTDSLLQGVRRGFESFTDELGTLFSNTADLTEDLLGRGLDALTEFTTSGRFEFRQFASDVVADIQRVVTRLLVLNTIRAFETTREQGGGVGGFFSRLFGRDPDQPTEPSARTDTGGGGGLTGIFREILGGGRTGQANQPTGASADPLFVKIATSSEETQKATEEQTRAGLFSRLGELKDAFVNRLGELKDSFVQGLGALPGQIGGFFQSIGTGLKDVFSGGLGQLGQSLLGGLGNLGSLFTGGLSGLGSVFSQGLQGLGSSISGLISGLSSAIGGGGGGTGGSVGGIVSGVLQLGTGIAGLLQDGGVIGPNQIGQAFITGESGPELFVPRQSGTVLPNAALAGSMAQQPPQVDVQVVNVDDARAVPEAMSTREGEKVILNTLQRNKGRLKEIIG